MFLSSFIIFTIVLLFTIYSMKKKWYGVLWVIAIIAFLAPFYTLYQTGISTNWRFLGDELWLGVILFIIVDIPSIIILGIIALKFNPTYRDNTLFSKIVTTMFILQILLHVAGVSIGDWI